MNQAGNPNTPSNTLHVTYDATAPSGAMCTASPSITSGNVVVTITCPGIASGDVVTVPGTTCSPTPSTS